MYKVESFTENKVTSFKVIGQMGLHSVWTSYITAKQVVRDLNRMTKAKGVKQ